MVPSRVSSIWRTRRRQDRYHRTSMSVVHTQDDDRGIAGAHVDKSGFQTNDTAAKS